MCVHPSILRPVFQDTGTVSKIYFFVGDASMTTGLMVPWLTRFIPRRWMHSSGTVLFILSAFLAIYRSPTSTVLSLLFYTIAVVTIIVCFKAYMLDYVAKVDLGRSETLRMFYSAFAWTVGPAGGVWLLQWWPLAPFLLSAAGSAVLLIVFWWMRLGNGKLITRARVSAPNPLTFV